MKKTCAAWKDTPLLSGRSAGQNTSGPGSGRQSHPGSQYSSLAARFGNMAVRNLLLRMAEAGCLIIRPAEYTRKGKPMAKKSGSEPLTPTEMPYSEVNGTPDVVAETPPPRKPAVRRPMSSGLQCCARIERLMADLDAKQRAIVVAWFQAECVEKLPDLFDANA